MDTTALLLIGALGGMVFFLTGRSLILERRLSKTGNEIKNLKSRIRRLEDDKMGLEAALEEEKQRTKDHEKNLGAGQVQPLGRLLKKARRSVRLCVPELTQEIADALPKKIDARVIAGKIGTVDKLRFPCATNPTIDLSVAVVDGTAYRADGKKIRKLPDAKHIKEGFETLWNGSKAIT